MASIIPKIIERDSGRDPCFIDILVKNKWRWDWLSEIDIVEVRYVYLCMKYHLFV